MKNQRTEKEVNSIIDNLLKESTINKTEKNILNNLLSTLLNNSEELKELKKDNKLYNDLIEQKQITKYWFDKLQDLKQDHERLLYKTGIKKIVKDPYLSARGERFD